MEKKSDVAIVLKVVPYEERHRIVTALTEQHGRISALARNSIQSRRFGGALEPFTAADWHFVERVGANLYRVEEANVRRGFEGLRGNFQKLSLASVFSELMLKLAPEREPCPELFRLHANALAFLEDAELDGNELILLNAFLVKLLQWSGNQPQFVHCLVCQSSIEFIEPHHSISCIVSDAGWVCEGCRVQETRHITAREGHSLRKSMIRVTPAALKDALAALGAPFRKVPSLMSASRREHEALLGFLEALMEYHIPGFDRASLKSLRFLELGSTLRPQ